MGHRKRGRNNGRGTRGARSGRGGRGARGASSGKENESTSGRNAQSFSERLNEDISSFAFRNKLSSDFISLQENRNYSTVKLNKKLKLSKLQQINEMVDLNRGNFSNIEEMAINSMIYQRPDRRKYKGENSMYNEVKFTSMNRDEILKKSYRKAKIEFVKAKEVYDPSKDLIELLRTKNNVVVTRFTQKENIVDITEELIRRNEFDQQLEGQFEQDLKGNSSQKLNQLLETGFEIEPSIKLDPNSKFITHNNPELEKDSDTENHENNDDNAEDAPKHINSDNDFASVEPTMNFMQLTHNVKRTEMTFIDDNDDREFNLSYDEDLDDGDSDQENENAQNFDNHSFNSDESLDDNLMVDNALVVDDDGDNDAVSSNALQIGKFLGIMKKTKNGDNFIELPTSKKQKKKGKETEKVLYMVDDDNDNLSVNEVIERVNKKMYGNMDQETNEMESDSELDDPEFGFLEEDYVSFDVTQLKIDNIRIGSSNENQQYYVQAPYLFGFEDYQWLNKAEFTSFLIENGLPVHRVGAFLKSATSHLIGPQEPDYNEGFDEDEIYISDSSESGTDSDEKDFNNGNEEAKKVDGQISHVNKKRRKNKIRKQKPMPNNSYYDDNSSLQSDTELDEELMEGMEDLLTMHASSKNSNFDPLDIDTRSIRSKGKNKKLKLELNTEINPEFQKFLEEKYITRKQNKKDKKEEREYARKNNTYMLTKYPYVLEMSEILEEFTDFKEDPIRENLRFPPMDFHVNMILKAMAEAFGFPSRKVGKGKKEYFEARKPSRKKSKEPDWNRIKKLSTKRHVCFRMDVQLSREEKRELKRIKGSNVDAERMRNKGRGNFAYKEGEVVGANAKEIDQSSIGRRLLEKMGWQDGDALGPENNKGIIEPIKVVVKTSKKGIM